MIDFVAIRFERMKIGYETVTELWAKGGEVKSFSRRKEVIFIQMESDKMKFFLAGFRD